MAEVWIPAGRLREVIERHPNPSAVLAGQACERTFRAVRAGDREYVSLRAADSILVRLDLQDWWFIPAEDGGLADIYVDGAQYGFPDNLGLGSGDSQRRYGSEGERLAARRQSYRESKARRAERRAA